AFARRYQEAAADYLRAVCLWPRRHPLWYRGAPLLVLAGHEAGYRRHRREMLKRFAGTQDPELAERTAWACLLLPGSAEEVKLAAELAQRALKKAASGTLRLCYEPALGLAEFRQGKLEAADRRLEPVLSGPLQDWQLIVPARLVQAMARHQRLGTGQTRAA